MSDATVAESCWVRALDGTLAPYCILTSCLGGCWGARLYDVTDRAIKAIAEGSPALQQLNLGGVIHVTEMGLYYLAVNCVHLHTLNVDGCEKVTVKGLDNMIVGRKFVERSPDFFGYVPVRVRTLEAGALLYPFVHTKCVASSTCAGGRPGLPAERQRRQVRVPGVGGPQRVLRARPESVSRVPRSRTLGGRGTVRCHPPAVLVVLGAAYARCCVPRCVWPARSCASCRR